MMSDFLMWILGGVGSLFAIYTVVRVASAAYFRSLKQHNEESK